MRRADELRVERANTAAFINANPEDIILIPRTRVISGTGVSFVDGAPRAPQTFRLIDQSSLRMPQPGLIQAADGTQRIIEFVLLGAYDALVEVWDYWSTYEVVQVFPSNGYELRSVVSRRGA